MTDRWQPPGIPMDDAAAAAPTSFMGGRYRVEREIGRGAAGCVYLAFDTRLQRNVAVKELLVSRGRQGSVSYGDYLERFEREARAGGIVPHPNIVAVYELAIDVDGNYYLIMEYVHGTSLSRLLSQVGTLPADRAVQIALEVAKALDAVHEHDIVHRDLKPSNIMLTSRGVTKLADFGVAQVGGESQRTQTSTRHPGTPLYMSPEQRSNTGYIDGRSDLYSLGLILYEMLAGEPHGRKRQPLAAVRPDLSPGLIAIVDWLMMQDPAERYQSAGEVVTALGRLPEVQQGTLRGDESGTNQGIASETRIEESAAGAPASVAAGDGRGKTQRWPGQSVQPPRQGDGGVPRERQEKRSTRRVWVGLGGAVAAILIALVAFNAFGDRAHTPTPASTSGGTVVAAATTPGATVASSTTAPATIADSPTRTSTPGSSTATSPATARPTIADSPVPANAYVVADALNLITYAYPQDWTKGGTNDTDADIIIGFTNPTPFAYASIAKEDLLPSTTLDAYTDAYLARRFRKAPDWKPGPISRKSTQIAGQDARIVDFLQPNTMGSALAPKDVAIYNYYILTLHDGRAWTIGYATAMEQKDAMQPRFDVLTRTFAFCPQSGCTRQQTAPTVAPGQTKQVADAVKQLTLAFPADWYEFPEDKRQKGRALAISSPEAVFFVVDISDQHGTIDDEIQTVRDFQDKNANYAFNNASVADAKIGGEPGKLLSYTYMTKSDPNDKPRNGLVWIVNRGGKQFHFESADIKARRAEVETIIGSIVFTRPANEYIIDFSKREPTQVAGQYRQTFDAATGEYHVTLLSDTGKLFFPAGVKSIADFTLEGDVRQVAGADTALYGLSFRVQPQNAGDKQSARYTFLIDSQGTYWLLLENIDGVAATVSSQRGPPGVIKAGTGAANHLSVTCKGDTITLAVNGTVLTTVPAKVTQPGDIGITVSATKGGNGAEVVFKDLRLISP